MLAEISWNENNGGQWGDADTARVVTDLREAFYDISLHDRIVAAMTANVNERSSSNNSKETNRVMEIGDAQDEGPGLEGPSSSDSSSILSLATAWKNWLITYRTRLITDNRPRADRVKEQHQANPKYVLRNWMAVLASEQVLGLHYQ